jgi:hypothetical protein
MGEKLSFRHQEMEALVDLAFKGIAEPTAAQDSSDHGFQSLAIQQIE